MKFYIDRLLISLFIIAAIWSNSFSLTLNDNEVEFKTPIYIGSQKGYGTYIIKFKKPLTTKQKKDFYKKGVEVIKYAGDLSYYFYAKNNAFNLIKFENAVGFSEFLPVYKISQRILKKEINSYAIDKDGNYLLNILFFKKMTKEETEELLKDIKELQILDYKDERISVSIPYENIEKLMQLPQIWHIEEKEPPIALFQTFKRKRDETALSPTTNLKAYELMKVSSLWKAPYNLTGEGVKIALVDWGKVRPTHQEFQQNSQSRIKIMGENKELSFHATHIGGTIAAAGINPDAKGGAPEAEIYNYLATEFSYSRAISKAYADEGITLSHHAYLYKDPAYSGVYDAEASDIDKLVSKNPFLNVFMAGGNDRGNPEYPNWGMMRGPTNAKNVFTFGLSVDNGKIIKYYSNTGPVNDGRIKPDLCAAAPGNGRLLSTSIESDTAYKDGGGTSSATARAMGAAALILQEYKKITSKDKIRHDILKALLINTATDGGREGPDFEFGFGNMQPLDAVKTLDTLKNDKPLIKTGKIKQDEIQKYYINLQNSSTIKVTINWIDPQGDANNQEKTLINDIDIRIEKDGKIYYPFSLDKNSPENPATANGYNRTDNTEQIVIKNAPKGSYTLYIKGHEIITEDQAYAIVSNVFLDTKSNNDNNDDDNNNDNQPKIPLAPSNPKAQAIDESRIKLSWIDNSNNEAGFKIYRDSKLIHITNPDITSFTDSGLEENKEYLYSIKAYNAKGDSPAAKISAKTKQSSVTPQTTEKLILEDAENKNTNKWGVYDHIPWGYGKIENIYDPDRKSHAIRFSNSNFKNHSTNEQNGIGFKLNQRFNESRYKNIEFSVKSNRYFTVFIAVKTVSKNNVYLTYEPSGYSKNHYNNQNGEYVWLSLGAVTDNNWHTIKRDFQRDLESVYPNDLILSFKLFLVRGDVIMDDIALFNQTHQESYTKSDNSEVFINNCYYNILGRNADEEGKNYWQTNLKKGESAADVTKYFFQSDEFKKSKYNDEEFVEKAYKTILGREAETDGKKYWLDEIKKGKSRDLILYEFIFSKEFATFCDKCNITNYSIEDQLEAFIERMYVLILHRSSDPKGMQDWKEMLLSKQKSASDIVRAFFRSDEFLQKNITNKEFIKTAYLSILGREADNEGIKYWTDLLNTNKLTRDDLIENFLNSDEFKALVQKYQISIK